MITGSMKSSIVTSLAAAAAAALCCAPRADALTMTALAADTYQVGYTAGVRYGLYVMAETFMIRVIAGGSVRVTCSSPYTQAIESHRTVPKESLLPPNRITVTIPESVPAIHDMLGFENVPGGTDLSCAANWTATAEESGYTVGIPGTSTTFGFGKVVDSGRVPFVMRKLPDGDDEPSQGCIR